MSTHDQLLTIEGASILSKHQSGSKDLCLEEHAKPDRFNLLMKAYVARMFRYLMLGKKHPWNGCLADASRSRSSTARWNIPRHWVGDASAPTIEFSQPGVSHLLHQISINYNQLLLANQSNRIHLMNSWQTSLSRSYFDCHPCDIAKGRQMVLVRQWWFQEFESPKEVMI